jgi:hypothetical protein
MHEFALGFGILAVVVSTPFHGSHVGGGGHLASFAVGIGTDDEITGSSSCIIVIMMMAFMSPHPESKPTPGSERVPHRQRPIFNRDHSSIYGVVYISIRAGLYSPSPHPDYGPD